VAALDFNAERGNILPNTDRVFSVSWNDGFPSYSEKTVGDKTKKHLNWDFSKIQKLRFGRYTATLVAVYDDGQRDVPIEANVTFWVIPWRILGVILLIVLFIGFGLWAFMRFIWRNIRRQATTPVSDEPDANSLAAATSSRRKKKTKEPETDGQTENDDDSPNDDTPDTPTPRGRNGTPKKAVAQTPRKVNARPVVESPKTTSKAAAKIPVKPAKAATKVPPKKARVDTVKAGTIPKAKPAATTVKRASSSPSAATAPQVIRSTATGRTLKAPKVNRLRTRKRGGPAPQ
jgi:hypothetical protein